MHIRVALIEPDRWRSRGIEAVLTGTTVEVRPCESLDQFLLEAPAADVVLVSEAVFRGREREAIAQIREALPAARVLVIGAFDADDQAAPLFAAGANGCFSLSSPPERLLDAVRMVSAGRVWGTREALAAAIGWKAAGPPEPAVRRDEFRLLRMLEAGLTNKEIAHRLGFAESTVKARFNRLYRRFGVNSRVQLLTAAMKRGILGDRD